MGTYNEKFENLAKSVYTKIMEVAAQQGPMAAQQQTPVQQQVAQPASPEQPADQTALDPTMGAEQVASEVPAETQGAEVVGDEATGAEETQEAGDEVGMSEIQEMAGQLAQMLRDFKASNPEESVEAAKFAAGMVVAAAIDGMKYKERKDILKKIKAGEFNSDSEEQAEESEENIEQAPEGQEEMVAERLRKDDREDSESRKDLKPKEKKNRRSEKSPFSGINEDGTNDANVDVTSATTSSDIDAAMADAKKNNIKNVNFVRTGVNSPLSTKVTTTNDVLSNTGNTTMQTGLSERTIKLKKGQLEQIRLQESKTKYYRFTKAQILEAMKH